LSEAAFGDRPWEYAKVGDQGLKTHHLQLRTKDELWVKEDLINQTVRRLPHDWEYVAWVDADVQFLNPDWAQETIQQLQHFDVVQMFEHSVDLDPNGMPSCRQFVGFPASRIKGIAAPTRDYYTGKGYFHPGYCWACTRKAWDTFGGLLDINIVGGADHQMAHALFGTVEGTIPEGSTASYRKQVLQWQARALQLKHNVGFVPGTIVHYWHGRKVKRGYWDRWRILSDSKYDPVTDLQRNSYGLWQLSGNKPKLRDALRAYFRARHEDELNAA